MLYGSTFVDLVVRDTSFVRPADTTAYAVNDAIADAAAVAGGFTISNAARGFGNRGIITDCVIVSSNDPATLLQGEVWVFDRAVTAVADNAAFAMSDAGVLNLVGVIPFALASTQNGSGTNSFSHISGLNYGFMTDSTSADLRFLVKAKNAYTPASGETFNFKFKILQV